MEPELVFIDFVVRQLVEYPEDVQIDKSIDERGVLLQLTVNPADVGRVIGKRGVTAESIRTLLRALGSRNNARYNFKVLNAKYDPQEETV